MGWGEKKRLIVACWVGWGLTGKEPERILGCCNVLHFNGIWVTKVYEFVKTQQIYIYISFLLKKKNYIIEILMLCMLKYLEVD